jgi:hypothetical protein
MTSRASIVELSWRFFQNANSVLTDILFASNELMAVQAVIGMVCLSLLVGFKLTFDRPSSRKLP